MSGFFDHRVTGIDGAPDLLDPLRGQVHAAVCGSRAAAAGPRRRALYRGRLSLQPVRRPGARRRAADPRVLLDSLRSQLPTVGEDRGQWRGPASPLCLAHLTCERPRRRHRMEFREIPDRPRWTGARPLSVRDRAAGQGSARGHRRGAVADQGPVTRSYSAFTLAPNFMSPGWYVASGAILASAAIIVWRYIGIGGALPEAERVRTAPSFAPAARASASAFRRASSTAFVMASRSSSLRRLESSSGSPT